MSFSESDSVVWEGISELLGGKAKSQVDYCKISGAEISGVAKTF